MHENLLFNISRQHAYENTSFNLHSRAAFPLKLSSQLYSPATVLRSPTQRSLGVSSPAKNKTIKNNETRKHWNSQTIFTKFALQCVQYNAGARETRPPRSRSIREHGGRGNCPQAPARVIYTPRPGVGGAHLSKITISMLIKLPPHSAVLSPFFTVDIKWFFSVEVLPFGR